MALHPDAPASEERRRRRRGAILLVGALASLLLMTTVAAALWSATATGSGSAKAVTAQVLTVNAAASPTADLFPGTSGALQFSVSNPNPYAVSLTSIAYGTITSSDQANCPATNLTTAAGGLLGTPIPVPASGTSAPVSLTGAVTLAGAAPNGCQGVTFTVAVTLTGTQV